MQKKNSQHWINKYYQDLNPQILTSHKNLSRNNYKLTIKQSPKQSSQQKIYQIRKNNLLINPKLTPKQTHAKKPFFKFKQAPTISKPEIANLSNLP